MDKHTSCQGGDAAYLAALYLDQQQCVSDEVQKWNTCSKGEVGPKEESRGRCAFQTPLQHTLH